MLRTILVKGFHFHIRKFLIALATEWRLVLVYSPPEYLHACIEEFRFCLLYFDHIHTGFLCFIFIEQKQRNP